MTAAAPVAKLIDLVDIPVADLKLLKKLREELRKSKVNFEIHHHHNSGKPFTRVRVWESHDCLARTILGAVRAQDRLFDRLNCTCESDPLGRCVVHPANTEVKP